MNKKIKLSLLGTLIVGSALAITLPIVSCSSADQKLLTLDYKEGHDNQSLIDNLTIIFKELLDIEGTVAKKTELIESWKRDTEVPKEAKDEILNAIIFRDINKNEVNIDDAVEKIIFLSDNKPPMGTEEITGPIIRVILKKGYTSNLIDFSVKDLGKLEDSVPSPYFVY